MIINISGKQGSGKSTLMRNIIERLEAVGLKAKHHRFAEVLYEMHNACRDVARKYDLEFPEKHGRLLQVIGTEAFREAIDKDYWVKATQRLCKKTLNSGINVVIIDDCRFPNEAEAFNGVCSNISVRLEASEDVRKARAEGWRKDTNHASETALDGYTGFDYTFDTSTKSSALIADFIVEKIKDAYKYDMALIFRRG